MYTFPLVEMSTFRFVERTVNIFLSQKQNFLADLNFYYITLTCFCILIQILFMYLRRTDGLFYEFASFVLIPEKHFFYNK